MPDHQEQILASYSVSQIIDQAANRLARNALPAYALSLLTSVPLLLVVLVWGDVTRGSVSPWVDQYREELVLGLCMLASLLLPVRHLTHHLLIQYVHRQGQGQGKRTHLDAGWLQVLATGALKSFALILSATYFLIPLLLLWPRYWITASVGVFEGQFTEKGLRRSWQLSDSTWIEGMRMGASLLLVVLLLGINLHLLQPMLFGLLEVLGGFDLSTLARLMRLDNPEYVFLLAGVIFIVLDPLLTLVGAEIYLNTMVHQEGLDLSSRLDRLLAQNGSRT